MNKNYDKQLDFNALTIREIAQINQYISYNPTASILINIPTTQGLSSEMVKALDDRTDIRIAGAYTPERLAAGKKIGSNRDYYWHSVIYTKQETIQLIQEMEGMEDDMFPNLSEIQKVLYFYDKLKNSVYYDPEHERKPHEEIRSLRGLITKNTVCAGYAIMLKELLNRQGIKCQYVEGGRTKDSTDHAWNLVKIGDNIYPIDLTYDATNYRKGEPNPIENFANVSEFIKRHQPSAYEDIQDYEKELKGINPDVVRNMLAQLGREQDFATTTSTIIRKDGTKALISIVEQRKIDDKMFYKYLYADMIGKDKFGPPMILFGKAKLGKFLELFKRERKMPSGSSENRDLLARYRDALHLLFSKENIQNSLDNGTFYLGDVNTGENTFATSLDEITKEEKYSSRFSQGRLPQVAHTRSDGSHFALQQGPGAEMEVSGQQVSRFDCYEIVKGGTGYFPRRNILFSEHNLFNDKRQSFTDKFMARKRLDRKMDEAGGYIGYLDQRGTHTYNSVLAEHFRIKPETVDSKDVLSVN